MKKCIIKKVYGVICIVAAVFFCMKTYTLTNQSKAVMLIAENVEALSDEPDFSNHSECDVPDDAKSCWANDNPWDFRGISWKKTKKVPNNGTCICVNSICNCPSGSSVRD